jgi:DDE superfamily endonuclease
MRQFSSLFRDCVGIIDASHTQIFRLSVNQKVFYREDIKKHSMLSQLIVDAYSAILNLETGYPGGNNDKSVFNQCFVLHRRLLRRRARLMEDGGYVERGPL